MSRHQAASQKVRIQYSSKHAGVANAWKKWQGEVKGIRKMKTVQTKQEFEKAFDKWAQGGEFDGVIAKIQAERLAALELGRQKLKTKLRLEEKRHGKN